MAWSLTAPSVVVFGSAAIAVAVALAALRQRPDPLAWPLGLLMAAAAAWAIPHAISFGYADVEQVALWHRLRYPGAAAAPVLYLVFALKYAGYDRWLSRQAYAALAAVPVVTVGVVWTNHYHGLFWRSLSITEAYGASVFAPTYGPWYWINLGYLYVVTIAGLLAFGSVLVRSGPIYRNQSALMFVGGLVPLIVNGVVNFGDAIEPAIDLTTAALAVSGSVFAVGLYYLDLLEIQPVAREQLVEELDDGVVVVGPDERIRDFNPVAARILGDLEVDQAAAEVLPARVTADGGELVAEIDGDKRRFRARASPLTDERGREVGRIVYLNDVTELVEREQRISVLNRVLRHNIRNELTVVAGSLDELAERADPAEQSHVEAAREGAERVVDLAEKARQVERTLKASDVTETVPASEVAERVVTEAREAHPGADIDCDLDVPDAVVRVVDERLFELALSELVENAVVHNDRDPARVTLRAETDGERVRISVADDGPGIPAQETATITTTVETPLEHASGLGLWLVKWFVSLSDGTVSFEENDPRGSVVTVDLPSAGSTS